MRVSLVLAVTVFLVPVAMADLEWEKQEVVVQADVGTKSVTAEFIFRNGGERPVTITQVEAACVCSIAEMDKKRFGKGESGKLTVTFEIGDRTGTHVKTITVRTDDPAGWVHRLFLKVHLVQPPVISPRLVYWEVGESPVPRVLTVRAGTDETVHVTGVTVDSKLFDASVETVEEGKQYTIRIAPKDTRKPVASSVEIQTDWPESGPRSFKALARVIPNGQKR